MFLERRGEESRKQAGEKILVGYDLRDTYAQISYMGSTMEEPETAALVTGTELYNIPAVLCKRYHVNQWYFGKDALKAAEEGAGTLVTDLLPKALEGRMVEVEGENIDPLALLTLFVRRSLSLLGLVCSPEKIDAIMFTVESLTDDMVRVLGEMSANLGLKKATAYFQSHMESLYHFTLYQPQDLWLRNVYVCDFDGQTMYHYMMERNLRTTPTVVLIHRRVTENLVLPEKMAELEQEYVKHRLDEQFLQILQAQLEGRDVSSAYLLGEGFRNEWMQKSLQYLCRGRRGFLGNNLFSKGACYSLKDKEIPNERIKNHVYLGPDKLKANLGMQAIRGRKEVYYALLDAGVNWYDINKTIQFYAPVDGNFDLIVTPLDGKNTEIRNIIMDDLPDRPDGTTLLEMTLTMASPERFRMTIVDKGFGDLFPASDKCWEYELKL